MEQIPLEDRQTVSRFGKLMLAMTTFTFVIIVLGSWVRASDSGLACPDWPLCYGQLVPHFDFQIFMEWVHRLVAGMLGISIIAAFIFVIRKPVLRKTFGMQFGLVSVLFLVQAILGGLTVLHLLDSTVVSTHLINGTAFVLLLVWITLKARHIGDNSVVTDNIRDPRLLTFMTLFGVVLFLQIVVGGMVSTNYAGLACPDFPTCHGSWLPDTAEFNEVVQMGHRALGVFVALLGIGIAMFFPTKRFKGPIKLALLSIPRLLVLQVILGVINIAYQLPDWAVVLHLGNAILMMITTFAAIYQLKLEQITVSAPARETSQQFVEAPL